MSTAAMLMLLASAEDLAPLHDWPPAGGLVDEVLDVGHGHGGGLTERDLLRLRTWSRRYSELAPQVQAWYARHAGDWAVSVALWAVLDGRSAPSGAAYGRLLELWDRDHGGRPAFDLVPRLD